jgi:type IV secretory pathway VirB4 component
MANEPSTLERLPLSDIRDGVIYMKDGSLRGVISVSAVNFELRSSDEQAAILQQFQGFLNSLDFPVQMLSQSRKFDITKYIEYVREATADQTNELLKMQAEEYMRFVSELSELANIMSKRFFVIIPLAASMLPSEKKSGGGLFGFMKKKKAPAADAPPTSPEQPEQPSAAAEQMKLRADLVINGLGAVGLKGELLTQEQLVALFADLFNPVVPQRLKS